MKTIYLYTDGACSGNQNKNNIGGWGALLEYKSHRKEIFGGEINTTNNRMEMTALIKALETIKKSNQVISVFSDSAYLVECFRKKWYINWENNGWKTSKKTNVENRDLWEHLFRLIQGHSISFYRVKGHVNLNNLNTDIEKHYQNFRKWNGDQFTKEDFLTITEKNNMADALANKGVDSMKNTASQ